MSRVDPGLVKATTTDDEALPRFVEDARAAGVTIGQPG